MKTDLGTVLDCLLNTGIEGSCPLTTLTASLADEAQLEQTLKEQLSSFNPIFASTNEQQGTCGHTQRLQYDFD
jgi:hypothetical protein